MVMNESLAAVKVRAIIVSVVVDGGHHYHHLNQNNNLVFVSQLVKRKMILRP